MISSKEMLRIWIATFQARELDPLVALYAEDAVNHQVAAGEPAVGRERIRKDSCEFFKGFPDAWSKVENLIGDGNRAAWEWTGGGTFLGEFLGRPPTGRSFEIRGCGFFTFSDGLITLQRGYWDKLSWFSQIGLEL